MSDLENEFTFNPLRAELMAEKSRCDEMMTLAQAKIKRLEGELDEQQKLYDAHCKPYGDSPAMEVIEKNRELEARISVMTSARDGWMERAEKAEATSGELYRENEALKKEFKKQHYGNMWPNQVNAKERQVDAREESEATNNAALAHKAAEIEALKAVVKRQSLDLTRREAVVIELRSIVRGAISDATECINC